MARIDALKKRLEETKHAVQVLEKELYLVDIDQLSEAFEGLYSRSSHSEAYDYIEALSDVRPWCVRDVDDRLVFGNVDGIQAEPLLFRTRAAAYRYIEFHNLQFAQAALWDGEGKDD